MTIVTVLIIRYSVIWPGTVHLCRVQINSHQLAPLHDQSALSFYQNTVKL